MAGDIEETVEIHVNSEGLAEAAAQAEELKSRIDSVRDAWAEEGATAEEAGAEGAAAAAEQAAALEAVKAQLDGVRDKTAEVGLAQDASAAQAAGMADAIKAAADAGSKLKASQDTLGRGTVRDPFAQAIRDRYAGVDQEIQQGKRDTEEMSRAMADMERSIPREGLLGTQGGLKAASEMDRYAESIEKLKADLAQADPLISDSGRAIDDVSRKAGIAATSMGNWKAAMDDIDHGGLPSVAASASREMDGALSDMSRSGDDAIRTLTDLGGSHGVLSDVGRGADDAVKGIEDLVGGGGSGGRGGLLGTLKSAASDAFGSISSSLQEGGGLGGLSGAGMPALILGLGSAISTIGPVALSAGAGFAAFGAMAYPALRQVEHGLTNVTAAQQAYQQAAQVAKLDPTKANITAEQTALAQLRATYDTMPAPIRKSVVAIQDLGHAWSEAGKKSGIQKDALKDIPKAINDIKGLIPSVEKLGKATAPVISGWLKDFGKFEKSSGFSKFIGNMAAQVGPASKSLRSFGDALGSIVTDLTSKQNMAAGDKLLTSLSGLASSSAKGGTSGLQHIANGITDVSNAMQKAEKAKSGPNESSPNMFLGWAKDIGGSAALWFDTGNRWRNDAVSWAQSHGNAQMSQWASKHLGINIPGQGSVGPHGPGSGIGRQVSSAARQGQFLSPFGILPFSPATKSGQLNYENELRQAEEYRQAAMGRAITGSQKDIPLPKLNASVNNAEAAKQVAQLRDAAKKASGAKADIKAKVVGAAKAKSDLKDVGDAAKKAGHEKADVKAKVEGAGKAKSDLKSTAADAKKVSDTKADLKITVTGADAAKSSLRSVQTAAQQAGNTKTDVKVTVTGASAAVSSLDSVGSAASQMASGVQSGSSRATGAVTSMAASMRGAIAGLPAAFRAAGQSAGAGMASGIEASTGEAVAAARSMASQVEAAAKTELQSHSPSKKFQKIGADTILGYILGLEGGKGRVQAAMNAVLGTVPFKDTTITKTINELRKKLQAMAGGPGWDNPVKGIQATGLTKLLDADNKKLMGLAKQRMDLLNQIKAADALAKSVETAAASLGDVTTIAPNTQQGLIQSDMAQGAPGTSQQPFQNIQSGMKYQLSQIKQFRADIVKLKKEGLDKTSIKQLLNAGISGGGLSTAQQILGEGPGAAKQIANLQKQIEQASKQLGITGGNAAYEGASQIGRGLAAGLKDSLKAVNQEMASIAKTLVTSLMTALGASGKDIREAIKKLDKELGIGGGSGSGGGGGKPGPIVEHHKGARPGPVIHHPARHEPLRPLPPGQMMPGGARPGPAVAGSDSTTINLTSTILLDGKVVGRSNQTHTLRRARRNTRSGMTLPLRGT